MTQRFSSGLLGLGSFVLFLPVQGQPPPGYYDAAAGLSGPALKTALYDIISPHLVHSYAQLWNDLETTDDRDDGYVWDIYSDVPGGSAPYLYSFGTDQCGTYNSEGDCYNREHTVPQSWFNSLSPMVTDLFHVYPTDGWVNQKRGDLPYGEVGAIDYQSQNGTKTGDSNTPGYNGTVCEPIDAYKGDLARTYFYMMTRYTNEVDGWSSDMFNGNDLSIWAKNMLVLWHENDPVSQKEVDRNNAVYAIQTNRNPYIDHPEWVFAIWGSSDGISAMGTSSDRFWVADGTLHRSNDDRPVAISIMDAAGRWLVQARMTGITFALPTDLPPGAYLVQCEGRFVRFVR